MLCPELSSLFSILVIGRHDNALTKLTRIYQAISIPVLKKKKIVLSAQQRNRLSSKHARATHAHVLNSLSFENSGGKSSCLGNVKVSRCVSNEYLSHGSFIIDLYLTKKC